MPRWLFYIEDNWLIHDPRLKRRTCVCRLGDNVHWMSKKAAEGEGCPITPVGDNEEDPVEAMVRRTGCLGSIPALTLHKGV